MRTFFIVVVILGVLGVAIFLFRSESSPKEQQQSTSTASSKKPSTFATPKKSAHYETNTQAHASVLAAVPVNVVIDFNFDLAKPSAIHILMNGTEYGVGETTIDANKLALRRDMAPAAPDGKYTVEYKACWPDGSCHDGSFEFAIDRNIANSYQDFRGQNAVTVHLKNVAFSPPNLRISKGTTVTWVNDDSLTHYVNTDSHPAHTYEKDQNSKVLESGNSYKYTFEKVGAYPYHCSAHADSMTGAIVVE